MSAKVTFKRPSLEMEIEVGSLSELAGYIQEEGTTLSNIFGSDMSLVVKSLATPNTEQGAPEEAKSEPDAPEVKTDTAPKPRGRPKKNADPATATAPAPVEVPAAPAAPAASETAPSLAPPAPPTPPAPPPAPPTPPATPPQGVLAGKVIAALDQRKAQGANDEEWLYATGLFTKGASYDEAISVIRLTSDDKLKAMATALSVA